MCTMAYPLTIKIWAYPFCKILLRQIKGIENIPNKAPFIIAANHESNYDHLLALYPISKKLNKKVHFIAVPNWKHYLGKAYLKWAGIISLKSKKQAYDDAKCGIESGEIVGIFPEGRLERKNRRENPKTGAVRLAIETNTPILPIGIKFSYKPFSSTINIGKLKYMKKGKDIKKQTLDLMDYVYSLRIE